MTPDRKILRRNFLPQDLRPLLRKAGVDCTILVQAHPSLAESYWLLGLAEANEFIAGVVAWTNLEGPNLHKDLDKLQHHSKFKGIRHPIEAEPDDSWMIRKNVLAGFSELERRAIPYDLVIFPRHLKYVPRLRESCPNLKLIVDHIAKPNIAGKQFDQWAKDLAIVAADSNIWCKLSGLITEANHSGWSVEDLVPYVRHAVEQFGYDRLMFGSDWPVCLLAGSYLQVMDTLRNILGPLRKEDAAKLWGLNACKFYQIS
jgi:L-fuconolactonase